MERNGLQNVDLMSKFQSLTGQMVGRIFFGADFNEYKIMGKSATDFVAEYAGILGAASLHPLSLLLGLWTMKTGVTKIGRKYMKYRAAFD